MGGHERSFPRAAWPLREGAVMAQQLAHEASRHALEVGGSFSGDFEDVEPGAASDVVVAAHTQAR